MGVWQAWGPTGVAGLTNNILVALGRFLGFLVSVTFTKLWKAADLVGGREDPQRGELSRREGKRPDVGRWMRRPCLSLFPALWGEPKSPGLLPTSSPPPRLSQ